MEEEDLITDRMVAAMFIFGADSLVLSKVFAAVGVISYFEFAIVTATILLFFGSWVAVRAYDLRRKGKNRDTPLEKLQYQYVEGKLSKEEFEEKAEPLVTTNFDAVDEDEQKEKL